MGIRFACPNGHKLHVKNHLAGQTGFCPQCNARVQIPTATEEPDDSGAGALSADDADDATLPSSDPRAATAASDSEPEWGGITPASPTEADPPPSRPAAIPKAIPRARPIGAASPLPAAQPGQPPASAAPLAVPPPPPAHGNGPPPPPPPAVEWRVQTTTGEQLGPADARQVARWQAEGRLTHDAHVWRTGWAEWRTVAEARSELPSAAPLDVPLPAVSPPTHAAEPTPESHASRYLEKRRRAAQRQLYVAIALLVMVLAVGIAIVVVLTRPQEAQHPTGGDSASGSPAAEPAAVGPAE